MVWVFVRHPCRLPLGPTLHVPINIIIICQATMHVCSDDVQTCKWLCWFLCIQSPDWDSRGRSVTAPVDPASYSSLQSLSTSSYSFSSSSSSSLPHPVQQVAGLPPLPGEYTDGAAPPPLPKRGEMEDSGLYPPPLPRKGHTLPRKIIKSRVTCAKVNSCAIWENVYTAMDQSDCSYASSHMMNTYIQQCIIVLWKK